MWKKNQNVFVIYHGSFGWNNKPPGLLNLPRGKVCTSNSVYTFSMADPYPDMARKQLMNIFCIKFSCFFLSNFSTEQPNEGSCFTAAVKWFSKVCIHY